MSQLQFGSFRLGATGLEYKKQKPIFSSTLFSSGCLSHSTKLSKKNRDIHATLPDPEQRYTGQMVFREIKVLEL